MNIIEAHKIVHEIKTPLDLYHKYFGSYIWVMYLNPPHPLKPKYEKLFFRTFVINHNEQPEAGFSSTATSDDVDIYLIDDLKFSFDESHVTNVSFAGHRS